MNKTDQATNNYAEQEMINLCRKLLRSSHQYQVINVAFPFFDIKDKKKKSKHSLLVNFLKETISDMHCQLYTMTNGDAFIIHQKAGNDSSSPIESKLLTSFAFDRSEPLYPMRPQVISYQIPSHYSELRHRANEYLENPGQPLFSNDDVEGEDSYDDNNDDELAVKSAPELKGPLTPAILDHLEHLIHDQDIAPYLTQQKVCHYTPGKTPEWTPYFTEYYTSLSALKDDHFPKVDLNHLDPLFMQLCRSFDIKVLMFLLDHQDRLAERISLNLALDTLFDPIYQLFTKKTTYQQRQNIVIELNRMDIFNDIRATQTAIKMLHKDGYKIALDGITLEQMPYLRLSKFPVDYYKIHVLKDHLDLLRDKECIMALKSFEPEKIILTRCDHDGVIPVGAAFGIKLFQGWMIDDM